MTESATPATPSEAQAQLSALTLDRDWGIKLLANDPEVLASFHSLSKLAASDAAAPAEGTAEAMSASLVQASSSRDFASFIEDVKSQFPISDAVVDQIAKGQPISKADHELGTRWLAQLKADPERSAKLMRGDVELRQQMFHASLLASSNIKETER